jgi:hypothetical protein
MVQLYEYTDETTAKNKEIETIADLQLNVMRFPGGNGMNMTDGGEGARGYKHTPEAKQQFSKDRKGKNTGPRPNTQGRIQKNARLVYVFSKDGALQCVCESISQAAACVGVDNSSVQRCCDGFLKTTGGYVCQWDAEFRPKAPTVRISNAGQNNGNARTCYVFDGDSVTEFGSLADAAMCIGVPHSTVVSAVSSKSHTILGTEIMVSYEPTKPLAHERQYENWVHQIDSATGVVVAKHRNITDAAKTLGIDRSGIDKCLMGRNKTAGGFRWKRTG